MPETDFRGDAAIAQFQPKVASYSAGPQCRPYFFFEGVIFVVGDFFPAGALAGVVFAGVDF